MSAGGAWRRQGPPWREEVGSLEVSVGTPGWLWWHEVHWLGLVQALILSDQTFWQLNSDLVTEPSAELIFAAIIPV